LGFLSRLDIAARSYTWDALRSHRQRDRNAPEVLSGPEILQAMETDEAAGFNISFNNGSGFQEINLSGPYPLVPWQRFSISSTIPGMQPEG